MPPPAWFPNSGPVIGSLDGDGAGDHDRPYRFGWRPRASTPYPFNTRQYARLLVLRGRIQDRIGAAWECTPTPGLSGEDCSWALDGEIADTWRPR
jgi:hypothetical protein